MNNQLVREPIGEQVFFSSLSDPKFKLNRISANMILELKEKEASNRAVVPFLLRKGCKAWPDFTQLNTRLCELYGASLDADVRKYGGYHILNVSIHGLDDRFAIGGEQVTQACAQLLREILLAPKMEGGCFDGKDTALERQFLLDTIDAEINDKRSYALHRCIAEMCKGEPAAVRKYGSREDAENITSRSAGMAYEDMLKNARIEIMFLGGGDPSRTKEIFQEGFRDFSRTASVLKLDKSDRPASQVRNVKEEMEISQSKLVMGFRCGTLQDDRELGAMRLLSAVYGGTPHSRLFLNVREKMSLCYYCASRYDRGSNILMVDSGVEDDKRDAAQSEILNQLDIIRRGDFTEEEFTAAQLSVQDALGGIGDSLGALESHYTVQMLNGTSRSPKEELEQIRVLAKEDVVRAASRVSLDTVYYLTGSEESAVQEGQS